MSCNFLLIPLTCASALSPDFCFGNTSLMRKAPNEEKIEEAQDCDFAGKSIMFRNLKSTHKKWPYSRTFYQKYQGRNPRS